ncbi:MAG: hypothetical protein IKC94_01905 [Lentisphaeria bacterium]|nr:hypothetical protein [Lentisphaeria bacterium]
MTSLTADGVGVSTPTSALSLIFAAYGGAQRSAVGSRLRTTESEIFT